MPFIEIPVAAHHLLAIIDDPFQGGYDKKHNKAVQKFVSDFVRDPNTIIRLITVPDGICPKCPKNPTLCDMEQVKRHDGIIIRHLQNFFRQRRININNGELTVGVFDDPLIAYEIRAYLYDQPDYINSVTSNLNLFESG